ncbi:helix-turn-helix transcriptional regulator [Pseudoxanthomonas broegbernensis]|uniref:helix-turn-helix transcriptional regulator n=1 Tax=Pseudoxanthomonas broegbernensis TaxID=83619 RepID=UPI00139135B4|nr:AraC family transcriptional regulator [Pseudoxanthomonas broegbernensis]MBB6066244.1 AraC-like DNA-binding protein [Pseudoxanthomonas broegbernensis]
MFTYADLAHGIDLVGDVFRFSKRLDDAEPLLEGHMFFLKELQPGLVLHCAQVRDLKDLDTQVMQHPGIKLSMLVGGASQFSFGTRRYHLGPQARPGARNRGALVSLAEPDMFHRQWRNGREERKVSITLKREWLEAGGFDCLEEYRGLERFKRQHLSEHEWIPSPRVLAAAERILAPPPMVPALQALWMQSHCLEIVVEALGMIAGTRPPPRQNPRERQRMDRLVELLDSRVADDWSLQRIARHVGSNPTSLQRAFRGHAGTTIFEYQRQRRLHLAHAALSRDRVDVERAAAIAGYTSAANFATAFKRLFGVTPRQARHGY